jgi:hypothetical protein
MGGGGWKKENDVGSEFMYDIFDTFLRTFVNATMYPSTTIKINFTVWWH